MPEGFIKAQPNDNSYVFNNDPNFHSLNLTNFFNKVVTVNSFEECYYYVELGFGQNVFGIYDLIKLIIFLTLFFSILFFIKKNYLKLKQSLLSFRKYKNSDLLKNLIFLLFLMLEVWIVYRYVLFKSLMLKPFIDEYVSLVSNYNFFTKLDFNAGGFLGGSYSKYLTSGPLSAVGSVLGWALTEDFYLIRVFNYFWIVFLNVILLLLLFKPSHLSFRFSLIFSVGMFLLIPWWQGVLYSLGEITSMIVFTNAIFLFSKYRKFSLGMFGLSIFWGKLLTALPFLGFYLTILLKEKSVKKVSKDILFFTAPLFPWFFLINFKYSSGNLINFFIDTLNFILFDNSASGLTSGSPISYENIKTILLSSEFQYWNIFEKGRLALIPILCVVLMLRNRSLIDEKFGYITIPTILSLAVHYLWFWVLSPLKWMRYSQHFMTIVIITLFYLIIFELLKTKIDYFLTCLTIGLLFDNDESNFLILFFILLTTLLLKEKKVWLPIMKFSLALVMIFDFSLTASKFNEDFSNSFQIENCKELLISEECRNDYLQYSIDE